MKNQSLPHPHAERRSGFFFQFFTKHSHENSLQHPPKQLYNSSFVSNVEQLNKNIKMPSYLLLEIYVFKARHAKLT